MSRCGIGQAVCTKMIDCENSRCGNDGSAKVHSNIIADRSHCVVERSVLASKLGQSLDMA